MHEITTVRPIPTTLDFPTIGYFMHAQNMAISFKGRRGLYCFVLAAAFFVTRSKSGIKFNRLESRPVDPATGVRSDQVVWLANVVSIKHYPDKLRRIHYVDSDTGKSFVFLTNNFELPALTIALLYKSRWGVELFFKWIKQHLRIKHFYE